MESVQKDPVAVRPREGHIILLGKHQIASMVATGVDYLVMIAMVSVLGLTPVEGTVIGASTGALTNFTIGRHFTFQATHDRAHGQLLRYALVSGVSLGLNALGEHLLAMQLGLQYVIARVIIGTLVSFAWNYPMHRYFVFR
jgi:putative flippase GtrA